jgi:transposase
MSIVASEVGIDVSMAELVTSIDHGRPFVCANTQEGALQIAGALPPGCTVHVESSGGYERVVVRMLKESGFEVRVHNPLRARRLAEAVASGAKTDLIDARMLSNSGKLLPQRKAKSAERQALTDFSRAIDTIKETIAEYKKRRKMPELDECARQAYDSVVASLRKKVDKLEQEFVKRILKSSCSERYQLADSVPCIGPVTARICVCELPEDALERGPRSAASYAGVAPIDNSSGQKNSARVRHGNGRLKKGLYMAAIAAISHEKWARDLYARLMAKGRTHQQAMVPVMRRLLMRVVVVMKRGSPWQGEPPKY